MKKVCGSGFNAIPTHNLYQALYQDPLSTNPQVELTRFSVKDDSIRKRNSLALALLPVKKPPLKQIGLSFIPSVPKQTYLWLAVFIFGASSSVTRQITNLGSQNFVNGHNPISLCNVLFVGNLCALMVMLLVYGGQLRRSSLQRLSRKEWIGLVTVAILAGALAPSLIFQGLMLTSVNNVVLVGRLEPPLTLALSVWLLHETINRWQVAGAIAAFLGVAFILFLQPPDAGMVTMGGLRVGRGECFVAMGASALAVATIVGKKWLAHVPLGILSLIRTALGTVIFFVIALLLYGKHHFSEAFSPFLWKWMLLYGTVIVVVGQSFWIKGLRSTTISTATLASSFTPIVGIAAAYLILGEVPGMAHYIGGSVILLGILLSQLGIHQHLSATIAKQPVTSAMAEQTISNAMGFKGI